MVNLSAIFLGNIFMWYIRAKVSLVCGFKMMDSSRIFSVCVGIVNILLVKCRQGLSNCVKISSLFCFCKFLWLAGLKICACLNRTELWLELSIKFNQYSIRSLQKALEGFNNLWIHLVFEEFNWVYV